MSNIIRVRVTSMWESCQRTTFYVELESDEGFTMTPAGYATGSEYTNFEGLSLEEARDRALIDAHQWADFLQLTVEPFIVDGVAIEPSMTLKGYTYRREAATPCGPQ
jgi:hypothetical protein